MSSPSPSSSSPSSSPSSSSSTTTTSTNPRRVPVSGHGLSVHANTMFRKGATFHAPSSPGSATANDDGSPFIPPNLPRSQSNLDEVIDAYRRRAAMTIDSVGELLAAVSLSPKSDSASAAPNNNNKISNNLRKNLGFFDDDCVPRRLLDHTIATDMPSPTPAQPQQRRIHPARSSRRNHDHASDSGLGSSIASSSSGNKKKAKSAGSTVQALAVTRSAAATTTTAAKPAGLSVHASARIHEYTLRPLLAKSAYKPFHPVLFACASKINQKDIVCLRDLEKTILLLAPDKTKSAKLYLDFSLDAVRCLQTTVEYVSDREQTRPDEAPYSAGYFIDLVDQIHHYAQQLADARANKKSVSNMDINSSDQLKLHGGIAVNGRPAELVRVSADGRAVSISTGLPVELEEDTKDTIRMKRSASQELQDDEEIMRSMARRKKNAPPEEYAPKMCSVPGCTKEFKRPCDLTKHEKTHSRPWKCEMESCKYHEYGWPTEKERDRHMNDKHSSNPAMYECLFDGCTYKSKRDSNRKQHMEKTHGWTYVRTKTNGSSKQAAAAGKKTSGSSSRSTATPRPSLDASAPASASSTTQPTPQLVNMPTPASAQSAAVATPPQDEFDFNNTPLFDVMGGSGSGGLSATLAADAGLLEFTCAPNDILPPENLPAEINDSDFVLDVANNNNNLNDASAYASPHTSSPGSSLDNTSAYEDIAPDMYDDIYAAHMQLPVGYGQGIVYNSNINSNINSAGNATFERFLSLQPDMSVMTTQQQAQLMDLQMRMQVVQQQEQQFQQHVRQQIRLQQQAHQASVLQQIRQAQQQAQQQQQPAQHQQLQFSPLAETSTMLYTPVSILDEGFVDYAETDVAWNKTGPVAAAATTTTNFGTASPIDFVLFPPADMVSLASSTTTSPDTSPDMGLPLSLTMPSTTGMTTTNNNTTAVPAQFTKGDAVFDTLFDEMTPSMAGGYSQPSSQMYDMLY